MLKSSILNVKSYQSYLKNSFRFYGIFCFVAVATFLFLILIFFHSEIAGYVMDLYPAPAGKGFVFYSDLVRLFRIEIVWVTFFFLVAWGLTVYAPQAGLDRLRGLEATRAGFRTLLVCSFFFIAALFTAFETLEEFANSSSEYAYLLQAQMLSQGKLWERSHDLPDFFYFSNIVQQDGILVTRNPPGWPLFLSTASGVGVPLAIVNPILGALTLVVFYIFTRRLYGEPVAFWSLLAVALTSYFVFNAASFFSHVLCLLVTLLFVCNIYLYQNRRQFVYGLLAGFCLGLIAIIRYYTALLIFIPFIFYFIHLYRIRSLYLLMAIALGSIPFAGYFLWYNYSITGDAFLPVALWGYPEQGLGFVHGHTFLQGLEHLFRRMLMFIYWVSPGLLVLYVYLIWRKIKSASDRYFFPEDYIFCGLALGYFFYFEIGGDQYGPRFLIEGFPFMVAFIVRQVLQMRKKWPTAIFLASVLFAIVKFPFITNREDMIVDQRQDLYDLVKENNISNAVVIVTNSTSPIRPMSAEDLTRNDSKFQNDVIYALELPLIADQLVDYYNDRSFYKYVREDNEAQGRLIKIK